MLLVCTTTSFTCFVFTIVEPCDVYTVRVCVRVCVYVCVCVRESMCLSLADSNAVLRVFRLVIVQILLGMLLVPLVWVQGLIVNGIATFDAFV